MAWTPLKQSVLVPHDLTEASADAIEAALTFVDDPSNVAVLHVVEPVATFVTLSDEKNREKKGSLDKVLEQLRTTLNETGFERVTAHVRWGDAAGEIADYVKEHNVELVVMPSSRRSGVKRLLLGSVAEATLRKAPCPVLVLRAPASPRDHEE